MPPRLYARKLRVKENICEVLTVQKAIFSVTGPEIKLLYLLLTIIFDKN